MLEQEPAERDEVPPGRFAAIDRGCCAARRRAGGVPRSTGASMFERTPALITPPGSTSSRWVACIALTQSGRTQRHQTVCPKWRRVPLSGTAAFLPGLRARELEQVDATLAKPFDLEELLATVERFCVAAQTT
jgi:hypothetical protein